MTTRERIEDLLATQLPHLTLGVIVESGFELDDVIAAFQRGGHSGASVLLGLQAQAVGTATSEAEVDAAIESETAAFVATAMLRGFAICLQIVQEDMVGAVETG